MDTIDFAEDGRMLALRTLCGDLEDDSAMSDNVSVMHVRSRLEYITAELEHVVAAYREAVLALKALRARLDKPGMSSCPHKDPAECPWQEEHEMVAIADAALARFTNITETP